MSIVVAGSLTTVTICARSRPNAAWIDDTTRTRWRAEFERGVDAALRLA
ncbi:MAG: hypothetical protein KGL78_08010 [Burkholderiales bacterium]|nr:hypothetical protein [Burkholderiales bacterium]